MVDPCRSDTRQRGHGGTTEQCKSCSLTEVKSLGIEGVVAQEGGKSKVLQECSTRQAGADLRYHPTTAVHVSTCQLVLAMQNTQAHFLTNIFHFQVLVQIKHVT